MNEDFTVDQVLAAENAVVRDSLDNIKNIVTNDSAVYMEDGKTLREAHNTIEDRTTALEEEKLDIAGGEMTGNLTIKNDNPSITLTEGDTGNSLSVSVDNGSLSINRDTDSSSSTILTVDGNNEVTITETIHAPSGVDGNASTATTLETARDITVGDKTISFNGSEDIDFAHNDIKTTKVYTDVDLDASLYEYSGIDNDQLFGYLEGLGALSNHSARLLMAETVGNPSIVGPGVGSDTVNIPLAGSVIDIATTDGKSLTVITTKEGMQYILEVATGRWVRVFNTLTPPTNIEVGLGNVHNWTSSSDIDLDDAESYATSRAVKLVNDKADIIFDEISDLDDARTDYFGKKHLTLKQTMDSNMENVPHVILDPEQAYDTIIGTGNEVTFHSDFTDYARNITIFNTMTTDIPVLPNKPLTISGISSVVPVSEELPNGIYKLELNITANIRSAVQMIVKVDDEVHSTITVNRSGIHTIILDATSYVPTNISFNTTKNEIIYLVPSSQSLSEGKIVDPKVILNGVTVDYNVTEGQVVDNVELNRLGSLSDFIVLDNRGSKFYKQVITTELTDANTELIFENILGKFSSFKITLDHPIKDEYIMCNRYTMNDYDSAIVNGNMFYMIDDRTVAIVVPIAYNSKEKILDYVMNNKIYFKYITSLVEYDLELHTPLTVNYGENTLVVDHDGVNVDVDILHEGKKTIKSAIDALDVKTERGEISYPGNEFTTIKEAVDDSIDHVFSSLGYNDIREVSGQLIYSTRTQKRHITGTIEGMTLENLVDTDSFTSDFYIVCDSKTITVTDKNDHRTWDTIPPLSNRLQPNTQYIILVKTNYDIRYELNAGPKITEDSGTFRIIATSDSEGVIKLKFFSVDGQHVNTEISVIKHEDYLDDLFLVPFEGVKSVESPKIIASSTAFTNVEFDEADLTEMYSEILNATTEKFTSMHLEGLTLRSNGDVKDTYDLKSHIKTQRISEEGEVLEQPVEIKMHDFGELIAYDRTSVIFTMVEPGDIPPVMNLIIPLDIKEIDETITLRYGDIVKDIIKIDAETGHTDLFAMGGSLNLNAGDNKFEMLPNGEVFVNGHKLFHAGNTDFGKLENWEYSHDATEGSFTKYATSAAVKQAYDKAIASDAHDTLTELESIDFKSDTDEHARIEATSTNEKTTLSQSIVGNVKEGSGFLWDADGDELASLKTTEEGKAEFNVNGDVSLDGTPLDLLYQSRKTGYIGTPFSGVYKPSSLSADVSGDIIVTLPVISEVCDLSFDLLIEGVDITEIHIKGTRSSSWDNCVSYLTSSNTTIEKLDVKFANGVIVISTNNIILGRPIITIKNLIVDTVSPSLWSTGWNVSVGEDSESYTGTIVNAKNVRYGLLTSEGVSKHNSYIQFDNIESNGIHIKGKTDSAGLRYMSDSTETSDFEFYISDDDKDGFTFRKYNNGYDRVNLSDPVDLLKFNVDELTYKGFDIYHEGNKPTSNDVGLGNVSNFGHTTVLDHNSTETYVTSSVTHELHNMLLETNSNVDDATTGLADRDYTLNNLNLHGHILPSANEVSNIGASDKRLAKIFVKDIDLSSSIISSDTTILDVSSNDIKLQGFNNGNVDILAQGTGNVNIDGTKVFVNAPLEATSDAVIKGNLVVEGDFEVLGENLSLTTEELKVTNNIITINEGETGAGVTAGTAGIVIDRGTRPDAYILFDESIDKMVFGKEGEIGSIASEKWVEEKLETEYGNVDNTADIDKSVASAAKLTNPFNLVMNGVTKSIDGSQAITFSNEELAGAKNLSENFDLNALTDGVFTPLTDGRAITILNRPDGVNRGFVIRSSKLYTDDSGGSRVIQTLIERTTNTTYTRSRDEKSGWSEWVKVFNSSHSSIESNPNTLVQRDSDGNIFTNDVNLNNLITENEAIRMLNQSGEPVRLETGVLLVSDTPDDDISKISTNGSYIKGNVTVGEKLLVGRNRWINNAATITLAIGDADTGFDWISDGKFTLKANGGNLIEFDTLTGVKNLVNTTFTQRIISTVANGTAPLTVTSTTKVVNLNADLLDDSHADIEGSNDTIVKRTNDAAVKAKSFNFNNNAEIVFNTDENSFDFVIL